MTTRTLPVALTATVARIVLDDDQDRVEALKAALRLADEALAAAAEALTSDHAYIVDDYLSRIEAARHEARVALSLERGEA